MWGLFVAPDLKNSGRELEGECFSRGIFMTEGKYIWGDDRELGNTVLGINSNKIREIKSVI